MIQIARDEHEWRVRHREERKQPSDQFSLTEHEALRQPANEIGDRSVRIGTGADESPISIQALTADRPLVSLPENPFVLPPQGVVDLFVSSPLWIGLAIGDQRIFEIPTQRPSDSWVGPNTGPGYPAYANRTQCRQQLAEIPLRPHRALTPVRVANHTREVRPLERVVLALPYFSLFATEKHGLWTEQIEVTLGEEDVESKIQPGPPMIAGNAQFVSPPRSEPTTGALGRVLASVF